MLTPHFSASPWKTEIIELGTPFRASVARYTGHVWVEWMWICSGGRVTRNETTERLGISHPILQAPMAGGTTTPELVAAISNAGALGSLGAAYLSPEQLVESIQ